MTSDPVTSDLQHISSNLVSSNVTSEPPELSTTDSLSEAANPADMTLDLQMSQGSKDVEPPAWTRSVTLLCHCNLNLPLATNTVVSLHPAVSASFAACCFDGDFDKVSNFFLL